MRTSTAAAATIRAMPSPTMIPLIGTREISTKPVTTVPTIAPAVPIPDSLPTTVPVSVRLVSRILVTIGVMAASSVPGTMIDNAATMVSSRLPPSAAAPRTATGVDRHGHPGHGQQRTHGPAR